MYSSPSTSARWVTENVRFESPHGVFASGPARASRISHEPSDAETSASSPWLGNRSAGATAARRPHRNGPSICETLCTLGNGYVATRGVAWEDVRRVAEKYFGDKNRTVATLVPEAGDGEKK